VSKWSIAALVATIVAAIVVGILVLTVLLQSDTTLVLDLEPGECFELPDDTSTAITTVDTVDCQSAHLAEVFAAGELNPDRDLPYPDDDQLFAMADQRCATALVDIDGASEQFGILPVVADEASWDSYRGRYVCVAIPYGGEAVTGSLST
jgi:hypothetical protein